MPTTLPDEIVQMVWEKAEAAPPMDPALVRLDCFGALIYRQAHGDRRSDYGWEIDFVAPLLAGEAMELDNLRPLQWQSALMRRAGRLGCAVTALGVANAVWLAD